MFDSDIGAKRAKAFDMLVDRPQPDITAARQRHFGLSVFSKKRAYQIIRRSDFFDIIVFNNQVMNLSRIDFYRMSVYLRYDNANAFHRLQ